MNKDRYGNSNKEITLAFKLGLQYTELGWFDNNEVLSDVEEDNTFEKLEFYTNPEWMAAAVKCQKLSLIDALINKIESDANNGDTTVLDALLAQLPAQTLIENLPEEEWGTYSELREDAALEAMVEVARHHLSGDDAELREMVQAIIDFKGDDGLMVEWIDMVVVSEANENRHSVKEFRELLGIK